MYEQFYGFREQPFTLTPDPAFLFMGRQHRHAFTLLEYALLHGSGFALVTGDIGCGKTTLIRHLLSRIDSPVTVGLITNTHRGLGTLLPWVAQSLGLKPGTRSEAELYESFVDHLLREYAAGKRVVLIVDEAQNLCRQALEELRVLSNVNSGKDLLLQTILIGQPELRPILMRAEMRQLAQRIAMDYHLGPLQRDETHAYVRHRLTVAGGKPDLIASDAVELLHARTGGVPRVINQVCDTALVYGFADQRPLIDAELVGQVLRDRSSGGLLVMTGPASSPVVAPASVTAG
jgi:general secretion pathway protein A